MLAKTHRKPHVSVIPRIDLRPLVFVVILVLALGTSGYFLISTFSSRSLPANVTTIDISADMSGFSQALIRVNAGRPVTIRLTSLDNRYHNDGRGLHQWAVDELGVDLVAPPLGSNARTFTPSKPGIYTFYCDVCCGGRANPTMLGTLVVEA